MKEGTHCFSTATPDQSPAECPAVVESGVRAGDPLVDPVIEYANARQEGGLGLAVVGGYVYRGGALPQLSGRYVFGDWSESFGGPPSGNLFVAKPRKRGLWQTEQLRITTNATGELEHRVLGIGQDGTGELYVLTTDNVGAVRHDGEGLQARHAERKGRVSGDGTGGPSVGPPVHRRRNGLLGYPPMIGASLPGPR